MAGSFSSLAPTDLTPANVGDVLAPWGMVYLKAAMPAAAVVAAVGVVGGLLQSRLAISFKPLVPDFKKLNPATGFSRIFSGQTVVEQIKALLKLAVIGYIGYKEILATVPQVPNLLGLGVATAIPMVAGRMVGALQITALYLVAIGVLDYGYQYWSYEKSIRMTKQEVKQEQRQQEGSPETKQRQRAAAREMALRRKALKDVPTADVIITNPTHFAVAIRYKTGEDAAPRVIAKGVDLMAQQIKSLAAEHKVPVVENKPLARSLYAAVDVGKSVPPELYQAVAEVLAFVYSLRRQQRRSTTP